MTTREWNHVMALAREEVAWWETATPEEQLGRPRKYLLIAQALLLVGP